MYTPGARQGRSVGVFHSGPPGRLCLATKPTARRSLFMPRERIGVIAVECQGCGHPFQVWATLVRHGGGKFCSQKCWFKARDIFGSKNPKWKGGRCKMADGRMMVYARGNPLANISGGVYMLEYRGIAQKKLGRLLRRGEIVHHIDGDVSNNDPSNLDVITRSEHIRIHRDEMVKANLKAHAKRRKYATKNAVQSH